MTQGFIYGKLRCEHCLAQADFKDRIVLEISVLLFGLTRRRKNSRATYVRCLAAGMIIVFDSFQFKVEFDDL